MNCSISLDKFRIPIVISCGHTFEYEYLDRLKNNKCPLCRKNFYIIGPNWSIIEYMDLDIKNIKYRNHQQEAKMNVDSFWNKDIMIVNYYIPLITKRIKKRSMMGYSFTYYRPGFFFGFSDNVYNILKTEFTKYGFYVARRIMKIGNEIYISWY